MNYIARRSSASTKSKIKPNIPCTQHPPHLSFPFNKHSTYSRSQVSSLHTERTFSTQTPSPPSFLLSSQASTSTPLPSPHPHQKSPPKPNPLPTYLHSHNPFPKSPSPILRNPKRSISHHTSNPLSPPLFPPTPPKKKTKKPQKPR